jgi:hypothetical protein
MSDLLSFSAADPRVRRLNDRTTPARGDYVLYWMQVYRRGDDNAALAYAVARANELGVPCVVYEALRPDHPHASDRIHTFVLQGARDTARTLAARGLRHVFFLPRTAGEARGVLSKLAARARLVVSDDYPSFIVPAHNAAAAARVPCPFVVVDDCAVVPLSLLAKAEIGARTIRPKVARALPEWLRPIEEPPPRCPPPDWTFRSMPSPSTPRTSARAWPRAPWITPSRPSTSCPAAASRLSSASSDSPVGCSPPTRPTATIPPAKGPAGFRPTCTSAC